MRDRIDVRRKLNPAQEEASTVFKGPVMILASAGSGKTGVIVQRIINMIDMNIPAENILCLTYTNKAAGEMKRRITTMLSSELAKNLHISTFHSLTCRLLKRYMNVLSGKSDYEGYSNRFSIISTSDKKNIFFEIARNLDHDLDNFSDRDILDRISLAKSRGISYCEYPQKDDLDKLVKLFYEQYQLFLQSQNALDFDDLLFFCWILLENFSSVLDKVQSRFQFIMVDEYQDTNLIQYKLLRCLAGQKQNLCVVGDDDQSIYGFRGANIENIHHFQKDYPNAKVILLEENYRSTKTILQAASSVIKHNKNRLSKSIWSRLTVGDKIETIEAESPFDEAEKVVEKLLFNRFHLDDLYKDHVILFRTNGQSKPFEEVLSKKGIGYYTSNKVDFYDRKEIRDALAYLKISAYGQDDLSLLRLIHLPHVKIPQSFIKKAKLFSVEHKIDLFSSLEWLSNSLGEQTNQHTLLKSRLGFLFEVLKNYRSRIQGAEMAEIFREYLMRAGYFDTVRQSKEEPELIDRRLASLDNLLDIVEQYAKKSKKPTAENFLMKLALTFNEENDKDLFQENVVHLLTIHAAKGLEFSNVYLVGMEEGLLPYYDSKQCGNEQANDEHLLSTDVDEERRLCYVAFTRAKKTLCLSLCRERKSYGSVYAKEPSRFLSEIPDSLIDRVYGDYFFYISR